MDGNVYVVVVIIRGGDGGGAAAGDGVNVRLRAIVCKLTSQFASTGARRASHIYRMLTRAGPFEECADATNGKTKRKKRKKTKWNNTKNECNVAWV